MHGYSRSPSVKAGSCSLPNLSTCRPIPSFPSCLSAPVTTPSPSRRLRPPANPSMEDSALALCLHSPMARVVLGISLSRMTRRVRLFTGFEHGCALWSRYSPRCSYLVLLRSGPQPDSQSSLREWYGRVCHDCLGLLYIRSRMTLPDSQRHQHREVGKSRLKLHLQCGSCDNLHSTEHRTHRSRCIRHRLAPRFDWGGYGLW